MFRELCGDGDLKNAVIVTNRWGEIDHREADAREAELAGGDFFYRPVLAKGAQMIRHHNTLHSAKKIIRLILPLTYPGIPSQAAPLRMSTGSSTRSTAQHQTVTFMHIFSREVTLMFPQQQEDAPEILIAFVPHCINLVISVADASPILKLTFRQSVTICRSSIFYSVMGAVGSGKSTVSSFQLSGTLPRWLTPSLFRPRNDLNSS